MTRFAPAILVCLLLSMTNYSFGQVGINTDSPRKALEVAGDMNVTGNVTITNYNGLVDSDSSTFLLQETDDSIKSIDVSNPTGAALGYIQEYEIVNPNKDWVKDFDTGIDATDFVLLVISAVYDKDLVIDNNGKERDNFSLPYTATFIEGGTWHIIADYPMVANISNQDDGTWLITTFIIYKDLAKQFGIETVPMSGATTGSAASPIID